jgi:hypothetical protein
MRVDLNELLNVDPDTSLYEVKPGDSETPAAITVADWKEALLAINVLSRRVNDLFNNLERTDKEVWELDRSVRAMDRE